MLLLCLRQKDISPEKTPAPKPIQEKMRSEQKEEEQKGEPEMIGSVEPDPEEDAEG